MKLWGKYSGAGALICTVDLTRGDQRMKFNPIRNGGDGEKGLSGLFLTVGLKRRRMIKQLGWSPMVLRDL